MPLEFLREIATGLLPLEVTHEADVDKVRVLAAAGMILADLPEVNQPGTVVVRELTGFGRATLKAKGGLNPSPGP